LSEKRIGGVLLAAGIAKRLGKPKQLLPWNHTFLINHMIDVIYQSSVQELVVILNNQSKKIQKVIDVQPKILLNNDWVNGKSGSIKIGVEYFLKKNIDGVIIFVVDQPFLSAKLINSEIDLYLKCNCKIVAPFVNGQQCNPVLFDYSVMPKLMTLTGDQGGKTILPEINEICRLPSDDERLLLDIDSIEDYQQAKRFNQL